MIVKFGPVIIEIMLKRSVQRILTQDQGSFPVKISYVGADINGISCLKRVSESKTIGINTNTCLGTL
jgi:hypothetical protein